MTLGDIFDEGFDLYKKNLAFFILIAAVVAVPVKLLDAAFAMRYLPDAQGMLNAFNGNGTADSTGFFFWFTDFAKKATLPNLIAVMAYAISFCALAEAASMRYIGKPITLKTAYSIPLKRLPLLIWGTVVYMLGLLGGSLLCGIGILWPMIVWLFAAHAFSVERKGPIGALQRSVALVTNDGGRVFSALFLLSVLALIIQIGFQYPIEYAFEMLMRLTPQGQDYLASVVVGGLTWRDRIASEVASALSTLLLIPFFISVITVLYYDLRVRKEAYDVELLASDLGYPPLSTQDGYLPAAMVFVPGSGPMPPPPIGRPPYPSAPPGYRPPGYGPPPGYGAPPQGYAPPPPGYAPPGYAPPPPGYGQMPGSQQPPSPAPPSGWTPPNSPVPESPPPPVSGGVVRNEPGWVPNSPPQNPPGGDPPTTGGAPQ